MDPGRVYAAFDRADAALSAAGGEPVADVRRLLAESRDRLKARMRIALVGRISSGKSTLVNALLGAAPAPTHALELTFNVCRFRHADPAGLIVHHKDGAPPAAYPLEEMERLAVRARARDPELQALLRRIDHLEIGHPSPQLLAHDLIDTPGLDSTYGEDSANALRWLGRSGDEVHAASVRHAARADALVAVFDRGLSGEFAALLGDFAGTGFDTAGPVTTVGALTKVEHYWPLAPDPLAEGRRVAEFLMESAGARRLLFELGPVAGLLGSAASTFTEEDHADLVTLSRLDQDALARHVRRGPHFAGRELPDVPVPAARRAALLARFGAYGIVTACCLVREDAEDIGALRAELLERSGVQDFRRLLLDHFGNRADVIKVNRAVQQARSLTGRLPAGLRPALSDLTALEFREHAFLELAVLRDHYAGRLSLGARETEELLRVTGEHGTSPAARLGLPEGTGAGALAEGAGAGVGRWARADALGEHSGASRGAVRVIRRSYELLLHRVTASGTSEAVEPSVVASVEASGVSEALDASGGGTGAGHG